jgi:hypothetical protein
LSPPTPTMPYLLPFSKSEPAATISPPLPSPTAPAITTRCRDPPSKLPPAPTWNLPSEGLSPYQPPFPNRHKLAIFLTTSKGPSFQLANSVTKTASLFSPSTTSTSSKTGKSLSKEKEKQPTDFGTFRLRPNPRRVPLAPRSNTLQTA